MSTRFQPHLLATTRRSWLAGLSVAALVASIGAFEVDRAYSAEPLFSPTQAAAARVPAEAASVPGFANLVAAVKPAVVSVRVKAEQGAEASASVQQANPFSGTPFERFFRDGPRENGTDDSAQERQLVRALGSGFFVSADGYIVTNNHVVDHALDVSIVTDSGQTYSAKVVGTDRLADLALLKVDAKDAFPYVKLAKSVPKIGEWVVAMGNPFGLGGTVTAGIVSAEGRDIGSGPYDDYIQIDAPVNRGNSGGPTFNLAGEVIGVNTAIYSPSGGSVGIAFDVPYTTIASVIPQLQKDGHVTRGWLGVQIQPITPDLASSLGLSDTKGALVAEPQADSPAAKAGLQSGDVIRSIDGHPVDTPRDLARNVAALGPGKSVAVEVIRDGNSQTVTLQIGLLKEASAQPAAKDRPSSDQMEKLGLTVAPAAELGDSRETGLAVIGVDRNGRAAEAGVQPGDVIVKAGGKLLATPNDLAGVFQQTRKTGRKATLMLIRRGKSEVFVAVPEIG